MRALLMSDSHGMGDGLYRLIERVWAQMKPGPIDAYIHCGDGASDFQRIQGLLQAHDPKAAFHCVLGNCDFGVGGVPQDEVFSLGGVRMYLCHGHRYHVKSDLIYLSYAARERDCAVALYGHTHIPDEEFGPVMLVNPGSAADGRLAMLEIEGGVPRVRMYNLDGRPVPHYR